MAEKRTIISLSSTINDVAKTNKVAESKKAESHLNTKEIAPEELKAKGLTNKSTKFLKREYDVDIEKCPPEKLDKVLQKFYVEVGNFVMPIINK